MRPLLAEVVRSPARPLASVALVALVPKCLGCVLAYAGLGALLGLRGPQLCGASSDPRVPWLSASVSVGAAMGLAATVASLRQRAPKLEAAAGSRRGRKPMVGIRRRLFGALANPRRPR
jgi:hypothetical protein